MLFCDRVTRLFETVDVDVDDDTDGLTAFFLPVVVLWLLLEEPESSLLWLVATLKKS